ncbi:hypothetical protein J5N97_024738 [Dioscorea zingiberensis]|uniref:Leucine-rich repeat-containing N-terminal plant-type domain-containing protein n=1 Tax=Dioscorea zingiberensis TaxID=325984 RepID=A0A9D5C791_9LILI|nr:hypothetical protein J5N97_024738 [Dioscorea zingiberensis]
MAEPACSAEDRAALLSFKAGIEKDTTGILSSWVGTECCGAWEGIECHPNTGRVIALQLQSPQADARSYMKGTVSPSLGSLPFLQALVISNMKEITGTIPQSLANLSQLTQLYLENNMLQGPIPSNLGVLASLKVLSLSGNKLQGELPSTLGLITGLIQINVGMNLLTGSVPKTFMNLHALESLDLSHNAFSGAIPGFIGQFQNLTLLDMSYNQFSGQIPISLCSLSRVLDLSFSHNKLTGVIPSQIGSLKSLSSLSLSVNLLNGSIPESFAELQKLWFLDLSWNRFSGSLPAGLGKGLHSLISIDLSYSNLSLGSVPDWLRKRALIRDIHLSACQIQGPLPTFLFPDSLNSIDLSNNRITGQIPSSISKMSNLQRLDLSRNLLNGSIPETMGEIESLFTDPSLLYHALSWLFTPRTQPFLEYFVGLLRSLLSSLPEIRVLRRCSLFEFRGNKYIIT